MPERVSLLRFLAIIWLLLISVLFFLPASTLPGEGIFGIPHFDKYVHFSFFALLLFLWRFYFDPGKRVKWILLSLAFLYGLGVELIQHSFIANRAFDLGDVAADMTGAIAGLWFWTKRYIKK